MYHEHAVPWYLPCADLYEGSAMLLAPLRSTHHDFSSGVLRVNPCLRSMRCAVGLILERVIERYEAPFLAIVFTLQHSPKMADTGG